MTSTLDHKILEALGLPVQNCAGFTLNFHPFSPPTVSVRYIMDQTQAEAIAGAVREYKLVPADHA